MKRVQALLLVALVVLGNTAYSKQLCPTCGTDPCLLTTILNLKSDKTRSFEAVLFEPSGNPKVPYRSSGTAGGGTQTIRENVRSIVKATEANGRSNIFVSIDSRRLGGSSGLRKSIQRYAKQYSAKVKVHFVNSLEEFSRLNASGAIKPVNPDDFIVSEYSDNLGRGFKAVYSSESYVVRFFAKADQQVRSAIAKFVALCDGSERRWIDVLSAVKKSNPKVKVQFENEKNAVYQLQHRAKGVQDY